MSNSFITAENKRRQNQRFIIGYSNGNSQEVMGVQNVQGSYDVNAAPLKFIGQNIPVFVPNGEQNARFIINYSSISGDPFLQFTGYEGFNGYIIRGTNLTNLQENFSFTSGYLASYTNNVTIGQIPQTTVEINAYGNAGQFSTGEAVVVNQNLTGFNTGIFSPTVIAPGSISLSIAHYPNNRVLSYSLGITIDRNAIYPLGVRNPTLVDINWPILVNFQVQFAVNTYVPKRVNDYPTAPRTDNISLIYRDFKTQNQIFSFAFSGLILTKEDYSAGVDGIVIVNANYQGALGRPN